jgi:hypothetical protein
MLIFPGPRRSSFSVRDPFTILTRVPAVLGFQTFQFSGRLDPFVQRDGNWCLLSFDGSLKTSMNLFSLAVSSGVAIVGPTTWEHLFARCQSQRPEVVTMNDS